jgi:hypothetical protein
MDERMIDTSSLLRHRGWGAAAAAAAGEFAEVSRSIAWEFVVAIGGVVDSCPMNLCLSLSVHCLLLFSIADFLHLEKPCSITNFSF